MSDFSWIILTSFFFFFSQCPITSGLIPVSCATNATKTPAVCCPTPKGALHPCGYARRGVCHRVEVYSQTNFVANHMPLFKDDMRVNWPERVFQFMCKCRYPYWGADCSDCVHGREGTSCQHKVVYIRRNYVKYSPHERRQFQQILQKSKEVNMNYVLPIQNHNYSRLTNRFKPIDVHGLTAFKHWFSSYPYLTNNVTLCKLHDKNLKGFDYCHGTPGFLTFHRFFMLDWERNTRRVAERYFGVKNFSFPYWDWTDKKHCDICTDDLIGATNYTANDGRLSSKSPFASWKEHCGSKAASSPLSCNLCFDGSKPMNIRRLWLRTSNLPTSDMVRHALGIRYFNGPPGDQDSCHKFAHFLENGINCTCSDLTILHAKVHFMIKGTMIVQSTNSDDPLFIVHHTQVDRLFSRWFRHHRPKQNEFPLNHDMYAPGHCRHCQMVGFLPSMTHKQVFVDTKHLGYDYDNFDFGDLKARDEIKTVVKPHKYGCKEVNYKKKYKLLYAYLKLNAGAASVNLDDGKFTRK